MWPSCARSSRGTRCCRKAGRTSGSCARRCSTSAFRSWSSCPRELHPDVATALRARGVDALWSHQAEAFESAFDTTTIVTTGTASGKSLCFQLPTLDDPLARRARPRAVPLSRQGAGPGSGALAARDRREARAAGDLRRRHAARAARRRCAGAPTSCSPTRTCCTSGSSRTTRRGRDFFKNLAVVVIDEAHVYRGVFGSHVANVLRRLRRVCEIHGTSPRFLLASATVANPGELATRLTGFDDVRVISRDGSPGTKRTIAMWNPPVTDEATQARRSPLAEAADLLSSLVIEGARTIVFMKSRKAVELMARFTAAELERAGTRPGRADRAVPRGLHAAAAARAGGPAGVGRAARRGRHRRARARHRHRCARRGDLRDVPGHGRVAAADVGPRGAARPRAGGLRGGRGRAGPVLLPAPGRVPRAPRRGGDPRPRERAALRRAPAVRRARGAAGGRRRRRARPALARVRVRCSSAPATCASGPDGTFVPRRPEGYPAGDVLAAQRVPRRRRDRQPRRRRGDRRRRHRARRRRPSTRARSTCTAGASSRSRRSTSTTAARWSRPFDGHWYTQAKRETDTLIERVLEERVALGVRLCFGTVVVSEQVLAYQRRRAGRPRADRPDRRSTCRAPPSPPRRSGTSSRDRRPRHAARRRALADRGAAAAGDVRPLGHRRALDQLAPADRRADDLHLRRPPGRDRDRAPRLRGVRAAGRRRLLGSSASARASRAARPACSRPSAATSTSRCPRPAARPDGRDATQPTPAVRGAGRSASRPCSPTSR